MAKCGKSCSKSSRPAPKTRGRKYGCGGKLKK